MRPSISLPGRTRSFETKRFATEASRQAAHSSPSLAPHRRIWPSDVRDVYHSLQPYLVMQKGLPGRVARTTHVAVAPNIETHHQKNQLSKRRTVAPDHRHLVFRDQIRVPYSYNNIYFKCCQLRISDHYFLCRPSRTRSLPPAKALPLTFCRSRFCARIQRFRTTRSSIP
jgi:hypothetical protein